MHTDFISYDQFIADSEWLITIDAGHGGMIDGKYDTAPAKMYDHGDFIFHEGVFNRIIAIHLSKALIEANISHIFTTPSNYDVGLDVRTIRANNFKRLYSEKKHMLLSIHANAAPKGAESARGFEVFTTKGETDADPMATIFFEHLKKMNWKTRKDTSDGDPDKESQFYILRNTIAPAVLVELGFYSNRDETILLLEDDTQKEISSHLFNAIKEITNV